MMRDQGLASAKIFDRASCTIVVSFVTLLFLMDKVNKCPLQLVRLLMILYLNRHSLYFRVKLKEAYDFIRCSKCFSIFLKLNIIFFPQISDCVNRLFFKNLYTS